MRTPAQIAGHPIHPMLVTLPIGLWLFSFACDLIGLRSDTPETWATVSLYAMVGGIIGAAGAAIPGVIDFMSLRDRPTRQTALAHMVLNVTVLTLFAANALLRANEAIDASASLVLSAVAVLLLGVSGWLGGKLVYEKGVAVHSEGHEGQTTVGTGAGAGAGAGAGGTATSAPRVAPTSSRDASGGFRQAPDRAMARDSSGRETDRS